MLINKPFLGWLKLREIRCFDIGEVGRKPAYAPGHAIMSGEVTRRAALRGDGLSMMSKLA